MSKRKPKERLSAAVAGKLKEAATPGDFVHVDVPGKGDAGHVETLSCRITTLAQALAKAQVSLAEWEVERHVVNSCEVGAKGPDGRLCVAPLWQVKAWLRRKTGWSREEFRDRILDRIAAANSHPNSKPIKSQSKNTRFLTEISPFDLHLGKLAWKPETGEDYDLKIAGKAFRDAIDELLHRATGPETAKILFPLGQDFLHTDNSRNSTTAGTPQDVDGRWQKAFVEAQGLLIESIDAMRAVAPVQVVIVPGNHDRERMFYLGEVLAAHYRSDKRVEVDNSPSKRKYVQWGCNLLGFTHGNEEKHHDLPRIMADERPELWAKSRCREWHLGHFHKRKALNFIGTDTFGSTVVRVLPSLCGTDAWHHGQGYVGSPKVAEAYQWDAESGYIGHLATRARG